MLNIFSDLDRDTLERIYTFLKTAGYQIAETYKNNPLRERVMGMEIGSLKFDVLMAMQNDLQGKTS